MPKRLVVCCDGTWNDADSGGGFTNVVRIARAIRAVDADAAGGPVHQIVYYHSGVGSEGDALEHLIGGGTGLGLSRNVRDAYTFVANNFCDGDELFLFGFSRGAYTVRSVAGLIGWAGVLHKVDMDDFALLWEGFKSRKEDGSRDPRPDFPDRHHDVPIKCVGVWDTVGALGIPGHLNALFARFYQFQDTDLGVGIENAFHALAIDEHRPEFVPTLWRKAAGAPSTQRLEQVWFAGAHSDVGGGYGEHGLSDVALAWMVDRVSPMLAVDEAYLLARQDRRDGWALGQVHDSVTGVFKLLGRTDREVRGDGPATAESIHASIDSRRAALAYAPAGVAGRAAGTGPLGPVEERLRWRSPDPGHEAKGARREPTRTDPLMRVLRI